MTRKLTTQKLHKVLQTNGLVSSMFKPSQKINRKGYTISTIIKGMYILNPGKYNIEEIQEILTNNNIKFFERKGCLGIKKFQ